MSFILNNLDRQSVPRRLLILCLFVFPIGAAQAQAACPPGTIPYGTGQGQNVCGPDDSQQQPTQQTQAAPARWATQWGAIATYEPNGSFGAKTNAATQQEAKMQAIAICASKHRSVCTIRLSYFDQCAAMVVSDKGYNVNSAATIEQAERNGLKTCRDSGDPNCHVYYSACSLPIRIQ